MSCAGVSLALQIKASTVNGRIILSGEVVDAATLDKAGTIARQFGPEIINTVSVMSPQQVLPTRPTAAIRRMLRGDHKRAHATLAAAKRKDPTNKYVQNNLHLLEESYREGKAIQ
jgi:Flp pilus assembly secretin CpaC